MSTLSGKEFKTKYGDLHYKVLSRNLTHNGFVYQLGLNRDTIPFNPTGECKSGGLYFTDIRNLLYFLDYGQLIGIIRIPDNAQVYIESQKFKADHFILESIVTDESDILNILKESRATGCTSDSWVWYYAVRNGHLEILRWARSIGYEWNSSTCAVAAAYGHFDVLRWAHKNGCEWDTDTCTFAAQNGHLKILKWLRQNGCPWNTDTCAEVARNGHLRILKWARENGCEWDSRTCTYAAHGGHLNVLRWARHNGCEWDQNTCAEAAHRGHLNVLRWALENGCVCGGEYHCGDKYHTIADRDLDRKSV